MEKIDSFKINHNHLLSGIYVSRKDYIDNVVVTTFDLRMRRPNVEAVMDTGSIHAIEHLGATFLRNNLENVIYFGPMGCRTGFYLLLSGDYLSEDILDIINQMLDYIINFKGEIPGCSKADCGNFSDMNLIKAIEYATKYRQILRNASVKNFKYQEQR